MQYNDAQIMNVSQKPDDQIWDSLIFLINDNQAKQVILMSTI